MKAPVIPDAPVSPGLSERLTTLVQKAFSHGVATSARWLSRLAAGVGTKPVAAVAPPSPTASPEPASLPPPERAPAHGPVAPPVPIDPTGQKAAVSASVASTAGETDLAAMLGETPQKPWLQRPTVWAGALAILLIAGGIGWWLASRATNAAPVYSTLAAARGDVTLTVSANGTIQPTRTINIGSELSGSVLRVEVDVNDRVRRGQVLVILDTAKLRDQVLRSQAMLATASANVGLAAATTKEARASLGRLEAVSKLSGGKVPSRAELDTGRATLARAIASGASASAGVHDAQAALSTDKINLSKASITAPADGVVLTRSVDPGNSVAASFQAVTLLTLAEDLSKLRLWVYVDEADVGSVQLGQNATFNVSAFPTRRYPARITRVGFGSTITDNVVTYLTYLDVDNSDLTLRPGMTATASIIAATRKNVLLVPNTALRFNPTGATTAVKPAAGNVMSGLTGGIGGGARRSAASSASTANVRQVWVLRDRVPVAVAITPGISDGHMTEITGGDLQPGMAVITDQKTSKGAGG